MAIKPYDSNITWDFVPECEKDEKGDPKPDATVFELRGLLGPERDYVADRSTTMTTDGAQVLSGRMRFWRCQFGIAGIRNFPGGDKLVRHPLGIEGRSVLDKDVLYSVPDDVLAEVGVELAGSSIVKEEDVGKSEPESTSRGTTDSHHDATGAQGNQSTSDVSGAAG